MAIDLGAYISNRLANGLPWPRVGSVRIVSFLLLFIGCTLIPTVGEAQLLTGQLTEVESGRAVSGALVVLETLPGDEIARQISTVQGRYLFDVEVPGEYRVRVERIGAETFRSSTIRVPETGTVRFDLTTPMVIFELEALRAMGTGRCEVRPEEGLPAHELWDEARKALELTRLTLRSGTVAHRLERYERLYLRDRRGGLRMRGERVEARLSPEPFESRPAERLIEEGFVRVVDGSSEFYMPDAEALLSDAFLDTHCFRAVFPGMEGVPMRVEGNVVGVRFEPLDRSRVPDVEGVLWLDGATADLRSLEYEYVGGGLLRFVSDDGRTIGGQAQFQRLPDGRWVVGRWSLTMPEFQARDASSLNGARATNWTGFREVGGRVVEVVGAPEGEVLWEASRPAGLRGSVFDSLTGAPMSGGIVRALGGTTSAPVDSFGRFALERLPAGDVALVIDHPLQVELDLDPFVVSVPLRPGPNDAQVATPSVEQVAGAYCEGALGDDRGLLTVYAFDSETGEPFVEGELWVRTPRRGNRNPGRRIYTFDPSEVAVRVCGIFTDVEVVLEVRPREGDPVETTFRFEPGRSLGVVRIPIPPGGG